jgi:hypothetical protein
MDIKFKKMNANLLFVFFLALNAIKISIVLNVLKDLIYMMESVLMILKLRFLFNLIHF